MEKLNDSFDQFNGVLMDVNKNESNGEKQIMEQCDTLLTNTGSVEFHNVELVCNKNNPLEVSGDICISVADRQNGLLQESHEIVNFSDCGNHDSENNVVHDAENLKFFDISGIDDNVPKSVVSIVDDIVSNIGISADNENISNVCVTSEDVEASNRSVSADDVNVSNVFFTSNDVDVCNRGISADVENLYDAVITSAEVDASKEVISVDDVNISNVHISSGDLNVSNEGGMMLCDFSKEINNGPVKDEVFHDAVQFFKDPSSLNFFESVGTSNTEPESLTRSSMYINFDPLHARFNSQPTKRSNELVEISEVVSENCSDPAMNKLLTNVLPRESIGNILISFDSPVKVKPVVEPEDDLNSEPPKLYTENELLQIVKDQELNLQETFLKRQHELELEREQKLEELEAKADQKSILCSALHNILKEVTDLASSLSVKKNALQESLESSIKENEKLQENFKTSMEDLQSVENTFSDFHKRYEQCKGMLKVYTLNEENMKKQLENMNIQLVEKDEMYGALQSRTEEMVDKANIEVANIKKVCDAQVAVLKAQLKKSELKISSLENELKHVKIENDKLTSICDELMAKVSEG